MNTFLTRAYWTKKLIGMILWMSFFVCNAIEFDQCILLSHRGVIKITKNCPCLFMHAVQVGNEFELFLHKHNDLPSFKVP